MNVVIVDDDAHYRASLETLFEHTPGFAVAGSFPGAVAAVEALPIGARGPAWDLVLMAIDAPGGIEATRRLKQHVPAVRVVMMTVFEEPAPILRAICAGADGYLLKKSSANEILAHARSAVAGGASMTPAVARSVLDLATQSSRLDSTERDRDVLRCLVHGLGATDIAAELDITVAAVRSHIRLLYDKLQMHGS